MADVRAIILAAGKGSRMKSVLPKVLHHVAGRPVLSYVLSAVSSLKTYVVVGFAADQVRKTIGDHVQYVQQEQLLGTADAVRRVEPFLKDFKGAVLVLCGDTPLLQKDIVRQLLRKHGQSKAVATVLTAVVDDSYGYGRIVRDALGKIQAIREQKDTSPHEQKIREINVGLYCFDSRELFDALREVKLNPKKKEFYLTDVIEIFLAKTRPVATVTTTDSSAGFGINTREDLAQAQGVIRQRILKKLMANGVSIIDPATTYIEAGVSIGTDTVIYPCTFIHKDVKIGRNCRIGPLARIRPGSRIADGCEIGNFTEVSRARLGKGVAMKHFSFLGDAQVGTKVNIGAGTVTANYDGVRKSKTTIGDEAFIGSSAVLIAPLTVGKKAVVGAGAVVLKNTKVPGGSLAVGVPAKVKTLWHN